MLAGRGIDIPAMLDRLKATARELDLPFGDRRYTYNSRNAQELGKWAEHQGAGDAYHLAVFKAYFADGKNLARPDVLADIIRDIGLDPHEAAAVLDDGRYAPAVDDDWQRCRRLGITAVPTFRYGNRTLVGAQPYAALETLVSGQKTGETGPLP